jgi:glycyl-tRNA synthetase beta chain
VRDFVLEIGSENLPASYVEPAFRQLADEAETLFSELRLPWHELYATGTPRRIVLLISGLAERQESAEETVTGPPVGKGFDEDGAPTKAALGFASAQGVSVEELQAISTARGEYLGFKRKLERHRTTDLLAEHIPPLIRSLRFPKVMKWESTGTKFARPVRWIVCLYGSRPVPFTFADVESGRTSHGRPWMRRERVRVRSAETYLSDVARLGVIVDDEARRERIVSLAGRAAARKGLAPVRDQGLMDELAYMLEDPRVLTGQFPAEYLRLPPEVVTTAMRSHQRYVAMEDNAGRLVPSFITFTDGPVGGGSEVRRGNEKVLKARLADAQFYWQEDLKRGVSGLAEELKRIVFIEGLGTIGQKTDRIAGLARDVNEQLEHENRQPVERIDRAAVLAKADLASEMIKDGKEFTLLQGLIGSYYSRECGEDPEVVEAVKQHYWPRTPTDPVPTSTLGAVIGVADRVDTICGCFLVDLLPTGSQDPYGLRRQANGLMRILETYPAVRLDALVRRSVGLYVEAQLAGEDAAGRAVARLDDFFESRCEAFLKERGIPYDVVDAVSRVSWSRPGVALARAREIARLRGDEVFERLITGVKRVGNILSKDKRTYGASWDSIQGAFRPSGAMAAPSPSDAYSTERFVDPAEFKLQEAIAAALPELVDFDRRHDFASILRTLSRLADPIDEYFDRVLVNCEDAGLRENRHGFLAAVFSVFARYADYSYIVDAAET